ncbi:PIN domain-like protein [Fomitopsis betulina]|nr:PIN domain-like protein [Fomitopsis betulina]
MGVHGLWEVLKPVSTSRSIEEFFISEGFNHRRGERLFRLGVQGTFGIGRVRSGENPELRTLFFRLARLLRLPVHAVFVFDGPGRPIKKRAFIIAFGYDWWMAPGEAEAELAYMDSVALIDGVMTDDSDALMFGAQTVIRNYDAKTQTMTVVTAHDVLVHNSTVLTRDGMVLMVMMVGGDYAEGGLRGFGGHVVHGLARYGHGDALCQALWTLDSQPLAAFLSEWRDKVRRTLCEDEQHILGRRYRKLSTQIPDSFPDLAIVNLYMCAVTSNYEDIDLNMARPPDIVTLGTLCERYFAWGSSDGIVTRFHSLLLPGVVTHLLINQATNCDMAEDM